MKADGNCEISEMYFYLFPACVIIHLIRRNTYTMVLNFRCKVALRRIKNDHFSFEKTRKINMLLQRAGGDPVNLNSLAEILSDNIDANCYIVNEQGKILGYYLVDHMETAALKPENSDLYFDVEFNQTMLHITDARSFNKVDDGDILTEDGPIKHKFLMVVPIKGRGDRLGNLLLSRSEDDFVEDDYILAEYGATVAALEVLRQKNEEMEEMERKIAAVRIAVDTLSFSEIAAMKKIFENLEGNEGYLVASKIADEAQITRSVIVNALRKLESAGVIQSRSLGMKGTYIKILNDLLKEEFERRDM